MTVLARIAPVSALPDLVREAATRLAAAQSSAEVLDARDAASLAYDAAKSAARITRGRARIDHSDALRGWLRTRHYRAA